MSKDILAAIPSSRNAGGIQALTGMSTTTDSGGISGGTGGNCGNIHGGRGNDSRTTMTASAPGGPGRSAAGDMVNVAGAGGGTQPSGGWAKRNVRGGAQCRPREGGNSFSGSFIVSGATIDAGEQLHASPPDQGLKAPSG